MNGTKKKVPRGPRSSGAIDDIGSDLGKIKEIGVNHVILGPTDPDFDRVIDLAKQLSKFTR